MKFNLNLNNKNKTYLVQRIIGIAAAVISTSVCGGIALWHHRVERKEQRKEKAKDYDLRNQNG